MASKAEDIEARLSLMTEEDSTERADLLNELAWEVFFTDLPRALALSREAEGLARRREYAKGLAYSLLNAGLALTAIANFDESLACAQEALPLLIELGDQDSEARALNLIGTVYYRRGKFDKALEYYNQSLRLHLALGDRGREAAMLANISSVHATMWNYSEALSLLLQSLKISEEIGDVRGQAATMQNLALVYMDLGDHTRAVETLLESLRLFEQANNQGGAIMCLANLGQAYRRQGNYPQALECSLRALRSAEEIGDRLNQTIALINMGEVYATLENKAAALEYLGRGLVLAREIDDLESEAEACWDLGECHADEGNLAEAVEYFERSLEVARQIGNKECIYKAHESLSKAHEKAGRFPEALEQHKTFHRVRSEVFNEEADQKTKTLMIQFQAEKAQKETEISRLKNVELAQALQDLQKADETKSRLLEQLARQSRLLERQSRQDSLTGLHNRRYLNQRLAQEFKRTRRYHHPLSVAMIDLDGLKDVNDRFTHQVGDKALQTVARLLLKACRTTDFAARFGGDEFVIFFPETPASDAVCMCEKIRQAVEMYDWAKVHPGAKVSISIGISDDRDTSGYQELLQKADNQLYTAKKNGRNQVRF